MMIFNMILLGFLVVCAVSVAFGSPDLAITEAAVGAGVTSILFFVTLKKIHALQQELREEESNESSQETK